MNESVALLLLRHLFPQWNIARDEIGIWRAAGPILISSSDLDGLLDMLAVADPGATREAIRLLKEEHPARC